MKKIFILIICFMIVPLCIFAQEEAEFESNEYPAEEEEVFDEVKKEKKPFEFKPRTFEIGLAHINFGVSNDYVSFGDIFSDTFVIDLDKLGDGFKMNGNLFISPLFFNFNKDDLWGFGLSTGMSLTGNIDLSGNMLVFKETVNSKSDLNAAVFAEIGIPGFVNVKNFNIKFKPMVYYPIIYVESDVSYTYKNTDEGTLFFLKVEPMVYSAFSLDDDSNDSGLSATPGVDFYLGVDYPLSEVLGLKDIHSLLDFDIGLDLYGVPLFSSTMEDYMFTTFTVGKDEPLELDFFGDDNDLDDFVSDEDAVYGKKKKSVYRPFKMHIWADWRPLGTEILTVTPVLGFAVNPLFNDAASFEGGIKAGTNIKNIFTPSLSIGYYDRLWKNSLDLCLNLRVFQLDLGFNLQAPSFAKSWTGGGFGMNFGLTFGW